jgi:hypothetical protein
MAGLVDFVTGALLELGVLAVRKIGASLASSSHGSVTLSFPGDRQAAAIIITFLSSATNLDGAATIVGETDYPAAPWRGHGPERPDLKRKTPMTMPSPILATAFMAAAAALLAMRATVVAVTGKSMVKVRGRQRRPANTKTQG